MKKKTTIFNVTILLVLLVISIDANADQRTPVEYKITTFGSKAEDCSAQFTNLENNETIGSDCDYCRCRLYLEDVNAHEENVIEAELCMLNNQFCEKDRFLVKDGFSEDNYDINPCRPDYDVIMSFTSLRREEEVESYSQDLLDLKEDDLLRLEQIDILKRDDCELGGWVINFAIVNPSGDENNPFGIRSINIPELEKGQTYTMEFQGKGSKIFGGFKLMQSNYSLRIDERDVGSALYRGTQRLSREGEWKIKAWLDRGLPSEYFKDRRSIVNIIFYDGVSVNEPKFKVSDKSIHVERENQEKQSRLSLLDVTANIVNIILAVVAIHMSIILFKKNEETKKKNEDEMQKDFLGSISVQLRCIERDITNHQKKLNLEAVRPPYDIHNINAEFYVTNLRQNILGYETEVLKESLILIRNEITTINRILHLMDIYKPAKKERKFPINPHFRELIDKPYYENLKRKVEIVRKDIKKILFHKHPSKRKN